MNINGYTLTADLQNANSGFSKWGFATKNGKAYFIKELINPVYPTDRSIMSEELFQQRRDYCARYEARLKKFFTQINNASHGNLIRINEFFRYGGKYYLVTEIVNGRPVSMEYIASLSYDKKMLLLKTVARCFYDLHSAGIVHFDVKPTNILLKETKNGNYSAKLIDFDSGFFKGEVIDSKDLGGDLAYLAPETFLAIYGENVIPDEKADIFALGLIFHEYFCGYLPYYDKKEYEYPYEAALDGVLKPDIKKLPEEIGQLVTTMLDADPTKRPSAEKIITLLNTLTEKTVRTPRIIYTMVQYEGAFGKNIVLSEDSIKYKNTLHTSVWAEMDMHRELYPPDYLEQKKRPISDVIAYEGIVEKMKDAGLWDLIKLNSGGEAESDRICQKIKCVCEDGTVYSYSTETTPDPRFSNIVGILASYCSFPKKYAAASVTPGYIPVPAPIPTPVPAPVADRTAKPKSDGWFETAGDL